MPDEPFLGEIAYFSYNFAPKGWLPCNGALLPISQHPALYSLLGTYYGGDGRSNFALPNLIARSAVGTGMGPGLDSINLGQVGGQEAVTLTPAQLPQHTHALIGTKASTSDSPSNLVPGAGMNSGTSLPFNSYGPLDNSALMAPGAVAPAGGNAPMPIRSPYLGLMPCIAVQGIFPSRS